MKKHPKLASDWATSFQNYVRAWYQTQMVSLNRQDALKPKALSQPNKMPNPKGWSEEEEELIMIEEGSFTTKCTEGSRGVVYVTGEEAFREEGKVNMEADVDPEIVQNLKMQIAVLQDQLAHPTKNVNH